MAFCVTCQLRRTKRGNDVCFRCKQARRHPQPIGRPKEQDLSPEQIEAVYQAALIEIRRARMKGQAA